MPTFQSPRLSRPGSSSSSDRAADHPELSGDSRRVARTASAPPPAAASSAAPRTAAASGSIGSENDILAELLPPARPPHARHFSHQSQGSLSESLARHSWAPTDHSHGARTNDTHPSKRPLLGRSVSSFAAGPLSATAAGTGVRMSTLPTPDEFGARKGRRTRSSSWDEDAHRRRRLFQQLKVGLETLLAAWAIYTAVRYFIGYTLYTSAQDRRIISLVLGSLSALSLILAIATLLAVTLNPSPSNSLLGLILETSLGLFIIAPAITSFALVFVWRRLPGYESLQGRCHWDIDVVWTGTGHQCGNGPGWGAFIAASSVRLGLTLLIVLVYLLVSRFFRKTPRPTRRRPSFTPLRAESSATGTAATRTGQLHESRAQLVSFASIPGQRPVSVAPSPLNNPGNLLSDEFTPPTTPADALGAQARPSTSSSMGYIDYNPMPGPSSALPLSYPPVPYSTPATSWSGRIPGADNSDYNPYDNDNEPLPSPGESANPDAAAAAIAAQMRRRTADMELIQFAAQFRSLVHQMQQDVAAGALTPGGGPHNAHTPGADSVSSINSTPEGERDANGREDYGFPAAGPINLGIAQAYAQGLNTGMGVGLGMGGGSGGMGGGMGGTGGGRQIGVEEREQMRLVLGKLVRRMPTIESLGSREGASSVYRMPYSSTASRPPTRLTMRSASDNASLSHQSMSSAAPSRSNSLTLGRAVHANANANANHNANASTWSSGGGSAMPTPPTPASPDMMYAGYFTPTGRASPMHMSSSRVAPTPSRPPTPRTPSPGLEQQRPGSQMAQATQRTPSLEPSRGATVP